MVWIIIQGINKFDDTSINDTKYIEKAKTSCKVIICWLFLASKDTSSIWPIKTECCTSEQLALHFENIKKTCLQANTVTKLATTAPQVSLTGPLGILAITAASTHDLLRIISNLISNKS